MVSRLARLLSTLLVAVAAASLVCELVLGYTSTPPAARRQLQGLLQRATAAVARHARGGEMPDVINTEVGTAVDEDLMVRLFRAREARRELQETLRKSALKLEEKTRELEEKHQRVGLGASAEMESGAPSAVVGGAEGVTSGTQALKGELLERLARTRVLQEQLMVRKRELEQQRQRFQQEGAEGVEQQQPAASVTEVASMAASAFEAAGEAPLWARLAVAAAGTYALLLSTVFRADGEHPSSHAVRPPAAPVAVKVNPVAPGAESLRGRDRASAGAARPMSEPALRGEVRSAKEGDLEAMTSFAAEAVSSASKHAEAAARAGMHLLSGGLALAADRLPAAGSAMREATEDLLPAFQSTARSAVGSTRALALELRSPGALAAGAPMVLRQMQGHVPGLLHGVASALEGLAGTAPEAHRMLADGAGRAMPVAEAALRAASELSGAAAELRM